MKEYWEPRISKGEEGRHEENREEIISRGPY